MTPGVIALLAYCSAGVGVALWTIGQHATINITLDTKTDAGERVDLEFAAAFSFLLWPVAIVFLIQQATEATEAASDRLADDCVDE